MTLTLIKKKYVFVYDVWTEKFDSVKKIHKTLNTWRVKLVYLSPERV